jgi:ABC-type multidrug transport system fused ATPase/permease subunit
MKIPLGRYWRLLARYLLPRRRQLGLLAGALLLGVAFRLAAPLLAAVFVNLVSGGETPRLAELVGLALGICATGVLGQVCLVAGTRLGANISWTSTNMLREDLAEHCLSLDLDFHHENTPGQMMERIDGDARELAHFFAEFALKLAVNLAIVIGVLGVMIWIDWRIALVYLAFCSLAIYVFNRFRNFASPYWLHAREASTELYGATEEWFGGLTDIRANGATVYVSDRFVTLLRGLFHRNRTAEAMGIGIGQASTMLLDLGGAAMLGLGAVLFRSGAINYGVLVAVLIYSQIIAVPLAEIAEEMGDLQRATASITRIEELFATKPSITSGPGVTLPAGAVSVTFDNVSFRYPSQNGGDESQHQSDALSDVSFALRRGEVLGLVGRTGSGKSTVSRLLLRFYDPASGRITLEGNDLRDLTLEQLRSHVGVVTQDVHLFNTTVRDNLTMFAGGTSDARLVALLGELGLGPWYDRLPHGLDSVLPPGGEGLSAGEAQLLAVARIFMTDVGLVILDEPSARLDPKTEALVQKAFDRLLTDRTGVIIAHRLETLRRADTIMVLRQGRVIEYGSRAELEAEAASSYSQALRQSLDEPVAVAPVAHGAATC